MQKTCKILILCNLRECCTPKQEKFLGTGKEVKWPQEWFNLKFHLGNKLFSGGWGGGGIKLEQWQHTFLNRFIWCNPFKYLRISIENGCSTLFLTPPSHLPPCQCCSECLKLVLRQQTDVTQGHMVLPLCLHLGFYIILPRL